MKENIREKFKIFKFILSKYILRIIEKLNCISQYNDTKKNFRTKIQNTNNK